MKYRFTTLNYVKRHVLMHMEIALFFWLHMEIAL